MIHVVRAGDLGELYDKSGWLSQGEPACNRRLAEFVFRNLQGSDYATLGYGSVEEVLNGDIELVRRLARTPGSDVHLYAVPEPSGIRAFGLWYSLAAGGDDLLPPAFREEGALPEGCSRREIAYGDWMIVDRSSRVRGLGRALFAVVLNDMEASGYRYWYGRTVVPDNLALYEKLYLRKGRAALLGQWEDGPLTRIGFLGDLRGGWTKALLETSLEGIAV